MVAPQTREGWSSEQRTCRRLSPGQKAEVVLAGLRSGRSVRDACREYQIAETLSDQWRVRLPEDGKAAVGQPRARRPRSRPSWTRLTRRVGGARAGAWPQDLRAGWWRGNPCGTGVSVRVARSRAAVAAGYRGSGGGALQAFPARRRTGGLVVDRPSPDPVPSARTTRWSWRSPRSNATDGTRMVAALASRELGRPVNRKRVQRVVRAQRLLPAVTVWDRRGRPGSSGSPGRTSCGVRTRPRPGRRSRAGPCLHAIVDCCTARSPAGGWRCAATGDEAIACVEAAVLARSIAPRTLTLGTGNGSQFTSRDFRATCQLVGSPIGGVATGIRSRWRSSSPGSGSSPSAWRGGRSGSRWTRREGRPPGTSTPTTTDPIPGWPIARQPRSPPPGGATLTCHKPERPDRQHPRGPRHRRPARRRRHP
jgi:putative transposase